MPEIEGIFTPKISQKQIDFSHFPSVNRDYKLGDEVPILNINFKELDFAVAVVRRPKALEQVKKIYQENDQNIKNMIKKYRKTNPKVEDVLFNGTATHDLNVYMALGVALYCDSTDQIDILVKILRNSYQKLVKVSSRENPYFAMQYLSENYLDNDKKLMHSAEELLANLAAINFLFKANSEDYFIDNTLKGAYGTAFYPLYNIKQHKAEQKDNKLEIKKMKELLGIGFVKPNSTVTIASLAVTNNEGNTTNGFTDSDIDILSKAYFSLYGDFADLIGIDSYLVNSYEIKGSGLNDIVYYVLISLYAIDQNTNYRQIDYLLVFYSLLYQFVVSRLFKNAKEELILNSDYEIAKQISNIRKENKAEVNKLKKELSIAGKENGRLESLVESAEKEEKLLKQELKELRGLKKEVEKLKFENNILKESLDQKQRIPLDDELDEVSFEEMIEYLNTKKLLLVGGHSNFHGKLIQLLPNLKTFDVSENNTKTLKNPNGNDVIFTYTEYLNHGLYYRIVNELSDKDKLVYLDTHVNTNLVLKRMYKSCRYLENKARQKHT
ncbi:hypothetical protein NGC20_13335 [Enterococcus hirae]|uniref:hypothetical protein n=1 Tax=Enterococcus hirae TaxID=1354 RepID=UPI002DBE6034|nr:hypothetical protein [Enterococcus hirae]MEB7440969.1 hypothetical protein [Enterococcus hirae]